ncbi:hypothetical protein F3Y22_tig00007895pilonHSYRG00141 [Hibiscus syriacus]|uniref:Reverse transcriptase domain-containing protein n=1 Tax=Hibiscus syriacus TaxID=106335 RepID=A0A6A3CBQ5_HIBSY|nr:hypothetical protein F3Y22_tig00007895pilonHSYRG00141 [Hibiscus syriacus]
MLSFVTNWSLAVNMRDRKQTGAADALVKDVSDAEIKDAIWGQGKNKSPVLVPKVPNPNIVKDFRPISCCSIIYKTATRILVNRLSVVFPSTVSMNQSIFVKGMSIVDNTLLAQELVRGYSRKKISSKCALKIDLQKAFDSLSWEFVGVILHALGLPEKFIGWILACFTNSSYSIVFNGSLVGYFKGARGVRQGSIDCVIGVQAILDIFYSMSGLKLNANKCEMYSAGISAEQCAAIREITGFKLGSLPVRYLGVPLVTRKLAMKDCHSLIDIIKAKLNLWANKHLSFAGRLQLICVVLFSMTNFWCKQLILSKEIIRKIKQLCGLGVQDVSGWNKACIVHLIMKPTISHLFADSGCDLNARRIWEDMCIKAPKVPWQHLVWFLGCIPKHIIIAWMAILSKLPARSEKSDESAACKQKMSSRRGPPKHQIATPGNKTPVLNLTVDSAEVEEEIWVCLESSEQARTVEELLEMMYSVQVEMLMVSCSCNCFYIVLVSVVHLFLFPVILSFDYFSARQVQYKCVPVNTSVDQGADHLWVNNKPQGLDLDHRFPSDLHNGVVYRNAPWKAAIGQWFSGCDAITTEAHIIELCAFVEKAQISKTVMWQSHVGFNSPTEPEGVKVTDWTKADPDNILTTNGSKPGWCNCLLKVFVSTNALDMAIAVEDFVSKCLGCVYVQRDSKSSDFKGVAGESK